VETKVIVEPNVEVEDEPTAEEVQVEEKPEPKVEVK